MQTTPSCPSCGTADMHHYCGHCGERRRSHADYSLRHFLGEALELLTHFDFKLPRTTWLLVTRPGQLSADHLAGRRVRYISPLRLFLLLSIVYYLSNSMFAYNAFTTPLSVQLHMNDFYPAHAAAAVQRVMQHRGLTAAELERAYDAKTAVLSRSLVFTLIPVIALLLHALLFRRRKYFAEHLVIATHFWSFALLLIGVFIPAMLLLLGRLAPLLGVAPQEMTADAVPTLVIQMAFAVYLYFMLRRAYTVRWWTAGTIAAAVAWAFFFIVWLFRFLLFEVTLRLL
jgi:hypothetical protein